jgi:hypothetical protein
MSDASDAEMETNAPDISVESWIDDEIKDLPSNVVNLPSLVDILDASDEDVDVNAPDISVESWADEETTLKLLIYDKVSLSVYILDNPLPSPINVVAVIEPLVIREPDICKLPMVRIVYNLLCYK